jgi:hypothetical protein
MEGEGEREQRKGQNGISSIKCCWGMFGGEHEGLSGAKDCEAFDQVEV